MFKSKFKLLICVIISISMCLTLCSCLRKKEFTVDTILEYMEEKYDEEFTHVGTHDYTMESMSIYVECESLPGKKIFAESAIYSDGQGFRDDYVTHKYEDELREKLENLAENVYGECRVIYEPNKNWPLPVELNKNSSLSDYTSNISCGIGFFVLLPPEYQLADKEAKLDKFYNILKKNKIKCDFTIYYMLKEEDYNNIQSVYDVEDPFNWYKTGVYFAMSRDYEIKTKEWK